MTCAPTPATPRLPSEIWVQILQITLDPIPLLRTFVCARGEQRAKLHSTYRQMQTLRLVDTTFFHAVSMISGVHFDQVQRLWLLSRFDWESFLWDPVTECLMVIPWRNRCEYVHEPDVQLANHDPDVEMRIVHAEEPSTTEDSLVALLTLPKPLAFRKVTICCRNAHLWIYGVAKRLSEVGRGVGCRLSVERGIGGRHGAESGVGSRVSAETAIGAQNRPSASGAHIPILLSSEGVFESAPGPTSEIVAVNVNANTPSSKEIIADNLRRSGRVPPTTAATTTNTTTTAVHCHVEELRIRDCGEGVGWAFEGQTWASLGIPGEMRTLREWCADGVRALTAALRPLTQNGVDILARPFQCPVCWRVEFNMKQRCDLHPQVDSVDSVDAPSRESSV